MSISAFVVPPDIITNYSGHMQAVNARIAEIAAYCPRQRGTTYYFSKSTGDDDTGDGSINNPWQTRAKAIAVEAAGSGDTAFLFLRGDTWYENGLWRPVNDHITIADYGDPNDAKPHWNAYIQDYSSATWTQIPATNAWTTTDANTIGGLREKLDPHGETRGTKLLIAANAAAVESTPNSWFWGSNTLTVNLNGDDPNSVDLEGAISDAGDHEVDGRHGCVFDTDGPRCENIIASGFGVSLTGSSTQIQAFTSEVTGTNVCYFKGVEGYDGSTHVLAHWSSGGGICAFDGCVGGFGHSTSSTVTIFNAYNITGTGNAGGLECWFRDSEAKYGRQPSSAYSGTGDADGVGFLCHTTTGQLKWVGVYGCKANGTYNPVRQLANFNDFIVGQTIVANCLVEKPPVAKHGSGSFPGSRLIYGSKLYFWPRSGISQLDAGDPTIDLSNCYLEIDMQSLGNNNFAIFNRSVADTLAVRFMHCFIKAIGSTMTNANRFGLEFDQRGSTALAGAGAIDACRLWNSIVSYNNADADAMILGWVNTAEALINNAYYQVRDPGTTEERDYGNTTNLITLTDEPTFGVSNAQLLEAATAATADMPVHSHDINGKRRSVATPDIGPVDFSSVEPQSSAPSQQQLLVPLAA